VVLEGKREVKRLFGRPRIGWENNIKTCFKEIECLGHIFDSSGSG